MKSGGTVLMVLGLGVLVPSGPPLSDGATLLAPSRGARIETAHRARVASASLPLEAGTRSLAERWMEQASDLDDPESAPLAVARIIDGMSEPELRSAISQLTNLDADDLSSIRDLHDYAWRMAGIAMNGVFTLQEPETAAVPAAVFASTLDTLGAPVELVDRFSGAPSERIYALFPTADFKGERVLVKWFREGAPTSVLQELLGPSSRTLVFGRYAVNPGDAFSHVWLAREQWEPGSYRVELFDPAEPLEKLAAGRFTIPTTRRP